MRAIITKVLTGSALAAAALAVSACGSNTTENTTENTMITDMNATEGMDTMTDNMTAVDGAMGNDAMLANDTRLTDLGIQIVGVRFSPLRAEPDVERAPARHRVRHVAERVGGVPHSPSSDCRTIEEVGS